MSTSFLGGKRLHAVTASIFRIGVCAGILFSDHAFNHIGHDLIELGGILRGNDRDTSGASFNIFSCTAGDLAALSGGLQILLKCGRLTLF